MLLQAFVAVGTTKSQYEVADVFRQFGDAYRKQYRLSYQQRKVFNAIIQCRTAALGGTRG
jgi:hypothetical protein